MTGFTTNITVTQPQTLTRVRAAGKVRSWTQANSFTRSSAAGKQRSWTESVSNLSARPSRYIAFLVTQAQQVRRRLAAARAQAAFQTSSPSQSPAKNPTAVVFTDTSRAGPSGPILSWHWDFGDGTTSTAQSPTHHYAPGSYTVTLTIHGTSPDGPSTVIRRVTVT